MTAYKPGDLSSFFGAAADDAVAVEQFVPVKAANANASRKRKRAAAVDEEKAAASELDPELAAMPKQKRRKGAAGAKGVIGDVGDSKGSKSTKAAPPVDSAPAKRKKGKSSGDVAAMEIDEEDQSASSSNASSAAAKQSKRARAAGADDAKADGDSTASNQKKQTSKRAGDADDSSDDEAAKPAKRKYDKSQDERLPRTLFVGNIPASADRKAVQRAFAKFGKIESVRIRGVAPATPKMPKKAALITGELHPDRDSVNAYVVFAEEADAQKALEMNNSEFQGKHLRVDLAGNDKTHDTERSVFIGNLHFSASEEDLRELMSACGEVDNVRIVRDPATQMGKGFAFVCFKDASDVKSALAYNGTKFKDRELRITKAVATPSKSAKKKDSTKFAKARVEARGGPAKRPAGSSKKSKADKKAIRKDRRASAKAKQTGAGAGGGSGSSKKTKPKQQRSFEGERAAPAAAESVKREIHRTHRNKSGKGRGGKPNRPPGKRSGKGKRDGKPGKPSIKKDSLKKQRLGAGSKK